MRSAAASWAPISSTSVLRVLYASCDAPLQPASKCSVAWQLFLQPPCSQRFALPHNGAAAAVIPTCLHHACCIQQSAERCIGPTDEGM